MEIELKEVIGLANALAHALEAQRTGFAEAKFDMPALQTSLMLAQPLIERLEEGGLISVARDGVPLSTALGLTPGNSNDS